MILPYSVDVPMFRYPFANWALIAAIALVSIGEWSAQSKTSEAERIGQLEAKLAEADANGNDKEAKRLDAQIFDILAHGYAPLALKPNAFSIWQLVTHVFSHGDIFHLVGNLVFLFVFGNAVDAKLGHLWFLPSFFLLGILSGLTWLLCGYQMPMIGASGAIMGITGMFLVLYPRNDVLIFVNWGLFNWTEFRLSSWIVILFYVAWDVFFLVFDKHGPVAYVAHLGGVVAGAALATTLVSLDWVEMERGEENLLQMFGLKELVGRDGRKKKKAQG